VGAGVALVRPVEKIFWIDILQVDGGFNNIKGCGQKVKSGNDIESIIKIKIKEMQEL
jgi:hypothetical protein